MKAKILITLFFLFFGKTITNAQLLWYADPNKPQTDNFYNLNREPNEEGTLDLVTDSLYGKVWHVNKPSGSKRTELARSQPKEPNEKGINTYIPTEGDSIYLGWRWKGEIVNADYPAGGMAIFQNKSSTPHSQNYPFTMVWNGKEMSLDKFVAGTGSQGSRGTKLWQKEVAENQWVTIEMKIKFSRDSNIGSIELWFNNVKQDLVGGDSNKKVMHRTLDDSGTYFKWGSYGEKARPLDVNIYLDEMRVAKDFKTANPNNYK
jgi:Polysaccharide lyase